MVFRAGRKKTFSKVSELAKAYAEGLKQGKARADQKFPEGRVFVEGKTIYSFGHHFPIAKKTGKKTAEFNTARFSPTTARQQSEVENELRNAGFKITKKDLTKSLPESVFTFQGVEYSENFPRRFQATMSGKNEAEARKKLKIRLKGEGLERPSLSVMKVDVPKSDTGTQFGVANKEGKVVKAMNINLSKVKSKDPLAYSYGYFQAKSGQPMSKDKDLAPEYVRGYNEAKSGKKLDQ